MAGITGALRENALFKVLMQLRGNARACVFTEPLFGIPSYLYAPFASLYMAALGLSDKQIGLLLTVNFALQILTCFIAGVLTDKFGRRLTTFIFDTLSWSIPCLLWAFAQDFYWFLAAAAFNSLWQIPAVSWNLLCIEDAEKRHIVHIYTWCTIAAQVAVFVAPLSSLFVSRYTLIPTMRALYILAFVLKTIKFVLVYVFTKETRNGVERMRQTHGVSLSKLFAGYKDVAAQMFKSRQLVVILAVMTLTNTALSISGTFFSLYATSNLGLAQEYVPFFSIMRSIVMLPFIFFIQHRINTQSLKIPMFAGMSLYIAIQVIAITAPPKGYASIVVYLILEAFAHAVLAPRLSSLPILFLDEKERAKMSSLIYVAVVALTSPFGALSGYLSDMNRMYPFALNVVLYTACAVITMMFIPKMQDATADA